jgi:hypothetical protein
MCERAFKVLPTRDYFAAIAARQNEEIGRWPVEKRETDRKGGRKVPKYPPCP